MVVRVYTLHFLSVVIVATQLRELNGFSQSAYLVTFLFEIPALVAVQTVMDEVTEQKTFGFEGRTEVWFQFDDLRCC